MPTLSAGIYATAPMPGRMQRRFSPGPIVGGGFTGLGGAPPEADEPEHIGVPHTGHIFPLGYEPVAVSTDAATIEDEDEGQTPPPDPDDETVADLILADGPVMYLRHGEAPGATTLIDASGQANHATATNLTLGQPGLCVGDPDTSALYPPTGYSIVGGLGAGLQAQRLTLMALIKPSAANLTAIIMRYSSSDAGARARGYGLRLDDGFLKFYLGFGADGPWEITSTGRLSAGQTYLAAGVWDGTVTMMYLDGVQTGNLAAFTSTRFISYSAALGLNIHREAHNGNIGAALTIDECVIFDKAMAGGRLGQYWAKITNT